MVRTCICIGSVIRNGISMIDFTNKEVKELDLMLDKLSRMCGVRNSKQGCVKCPLMDKDMRCAYLLLDKMRIMYSARHENDNKEF